MLLVSAEKKGCVSRAVGGGPAAEGSTSTGAIVLPAGELVRDIIKLEAGARSTRQVALQAGEYISWVCTVQEAYTVDFGVKLSSRWPQEVRCVDRPLKLVGVDKSRVVKERERGTTFQGYLDLVVEHAECIRQGGAEGPVAMLLFEIDNGFSIFTGKEVALQVSKQTIRETQPVPNGATVSAPHVPVTTPAETAAPGAQPGAQTGPVLAIRPVASLSDLRLSRLQALLKDAIRLCPAGATAAQEHLAAAQVSLEQYAQQAEEEEDLGPLS
mmetsp:Transcript_1222/g.2881  ORF Transcript_1222/g.2881 Transcript_1222/m.2881 type:complete len:270 (+) Transcript_1222:66-875(+)